MNSHQIGSYSNGSNGYGSYTNAGTNSNSNSSNGFKKSGSAFAKSI